jgi:hypothetical protein
MPRTVEKAESGAAPGSFVAQNHAGPELHAARDERGQRAPAAAR